MQKKISIIVPVYNTEHKIKKCINSIVNQEYKNIEIIIVNDGSTDNSLKICNEMANIDSRIMIINQDNLGVSAARNIALKKVTGNYVIFVDSDDYLEENSIQNIVNSLEDYDIVSFGYRYIYECKKINVDFKYNDRILNQDEAIKLLLLNKIFIGALWNKVFKRECIEKLLFDEDIKIGEDLLFQYNALKNSTKIKIVNKIVYNYVIYDENTSNKSNYKKWLQFENVTKYVLDDICKTKPKLKKYAISKYVNSNLYLLNKLPSDSKELVRCENNIKKYALQYNLFFRNKFKNKIKVLKICIKKR